MGTDDLAGAVTDMKDIAGKSIPPALVIIQTGEIVRRIDKFFGVTA